MSIVMDEQQAIEEHLKLWAYWYARLGKISTRVINFPTWEDEMKAGDEAWDEWDKVFLWLERHGIYDRNILYDPTTEQASLVADLV